jgi:hypothetical protein
MRFLIRVLAGFLLLTACSEEPYNCTCDRSEVSTNDSILKAAEAASDLDVFAKRYGQSPLRNLNTESYRLSMRHSFNRYFQVYTLTRTKDGGILLVQEFWGERSYSQTFKLNSEYRINLNRKQWNAFKRVIDNTCFWTMPVVEVERSQGLDGGELYLEGFQPDQRNCSGSDYLILYRRYADKRNTVSFYKVRNQLRKHAQEEKLHVYEN